MGLAASALGGALLDLRPAGSLAPLVTSNGGTVGLALGALGTSVLVQYGPVPTALVWWLLLGAFLAAILLVAAMPEPGTVRPGALASLRPDISVPRSARGTFARAAPCLVAVWALGGFYLSLGPSLAAQLSGSDNLLWGGVITFLLTGLGAVTSFAFRNSAPTAVMLGGCLGLLGGAAVTAAAIVASTPALLLLGTVLAGLGFGPGEPRRLSRDHGTGCRQQPGRADRSHLHRQLPRVRPPSPDRRHCNLAFWPARHRTGLLRRDRPARRRRRRRLPVRGQCPHPRTPGNRRPLPNCRRARAPCHRSRKQRTTKPSRQRHPSNHHQSADRTLTARDVAAASPLGARDFTGSPAFLDPGPRPDIGFLVAGPDGGARVNV